MIAIILLLEIKMEKYIISNDFVMGVHQVHTQTKLYANYVGRL